MKKIFTIILGIALILPLYSQETETEIDGHGVQDLEENLNLETPEEEPPKANFDFNRKYFEIGFDAGTGFDNGIIGTKDVFKKNVVINMSELAHDIPNKGADIIFNFSSGFFVNVKNIPIMKYKFDFGFLYDIDGEIKANVSKSLFLFISEGNIDTHNSTGSIGASGGIFSEMGFRGSTKIEVAGKPLYIGVKPSIYTPMIYIPSDSGIFYSLSTTKGDKEGIFVDTKGEINIYSPSSLENVNPGRLIFGDCGFDLSLEGEYPFFPFLDVGATISNIPLSASELSNLMKISMTEVNVALPGEDLIAGKEPEIPEVEFNKTYYDNVSLKVYRLFCFDTYARYKPFDSELLVLRPNLGFSVNINKGDEESYLNAGLEVIFHPVTLFTLYIGTSYKETIWRQKAGINLNFRAFELDLEAALKNQDFIGSFTGHGFNFNLGMRFGW